MKNIAARRSARAKIWSCAAVALWALGSAPAALANCRITDFTNRPLSSLTELERLAFTSEMTRTEYAKLKQATPNSPDYYALIVNSTDLADAHQKALTKIAALNIANSPEYTQFWASDYLTNDQIRKLISCTSQQLPGLVYAGRPAAPGTFDFSFVHLTPVGQEPLRYNYIASSNIANVGAFKALLDKLGVKEDFTAETFTFHLVDPKEPAVLVMRPGYETPYIIYIPAYPAPVVPQ